MGLEIKHYAKLAFVLLAGFMAGWLFDIYIMSSISPLGTVADFRKMALNCVSTITDNRDWVSSLSQIAARVDEKEKAAVIK